MIKLAILSNINIDSVKFELKKDFNLFLPNGFNTWQQELLDETSGFQNFKADFCLLIFDGVCLYNSALSYEIQKYIEEIFICIEYSLNKNSNCIFFVSDLDVYTQSIFDSRIISNNLQFEYIWSSCLKKSMNKYKNMHIFPLKNLVSQHGRNVIYSSKNWYLASNRFSLAGIKVIAEKIKEYARPLIQPSKKCIVLDLDNTLWGGIIGEDGIEGIKLSNYGEGSRFYEFQKTLKEIQKRGILLAIISKNNEDDAEMAFSHAFMILKKEDFAEIDVNWNNKSDNLLQNTKKLNIGLSDFIFIDDNTVEREEMKIKQPDVIVPDFPEDTTQLVQFAINVYNRYFYTWDISEEDIKKTQMYKENTVRESNRKMFSSIDDFIKDMNIVLSINPVTNNYILRTSQMTQKTNQFNLTTKRYSEKDISDMLTDKNNMLFIGHIQDKYGDNGNSILAIIKIISPYIAEIDTFLMSCRIMNRTIEYGFLYEIENILKAKGIKTIQAKYIKTIKNDPVSSFLDNAGYNIISTTDKEKCYELHINDDINKQTKKSCHISNIVINML
jgi:FkbH-like protein